MENRRRLKGDGDGFDDDKFAKCQNLFRISPVRLNKSALLMVRVNLGITPYNIKFYVIIVMSLKCSTSPFYQNIDVLRCLIWTLSAWRKLRRGFAIEIRESAFTSAPLVSRSRERRRKESPSCPETVRNAGFLAALHLIQRHFRIGRYRCSGEFAFEDSGADDG